jgi:hypothetical protein
MAMVDEIVRNGQVSSDVKSLVLWCQDQGADPRCVAHGVTGRSGGWGDGTEQFPLVPKVDHRGKSAISLVLGLISVLEQISTYEHEGKYKAQLAAAKQLMDIFAQYRGRGERSPVPKGTIDLWTSIRFNEELADLELLVLDLDSSDFESPGKTGSFESGNRVKAHSFILCEASDVLKASLASEMLEGETRVIPVRGASMAAVEVLLSVIYLGRTPAPLPCISNPTPKKTWSVGDQAEGNFRGRGAWWPCSITWVYHNGSCDITYDAEDGGRTFHEKRVSPQRLQARGLWCDPTEISEHLRTQLLALDIAHRWMIGHAVRLLEESLSQELHRLALVPWLAILLDDATFVGTLDMLHETASLKDFRELLKACRHMTSSLSAKVMWV